MPANKRGKPKSRRVKGAAQGGSAKKIEKKSRLPDAYQLPEGVILYFIRFLGAARLLPILFYSGLFCRQAKP
jgi:hypothetical protein